MSKFWFGNGNGYSYAVRKWTPWHEETVEFVSDKEAEEYFEPETTEN